MRVALADDSTLFRRGLELLLDAAGIIVVVSVGSGQELLQEIERAEATPAAIDVAVLDIRMPPTYTDEGLVTADVLRQEHPGVGVLVLSTYVEAEYAVRLLQDGGRGVGYLLKDRVDEVATLVSALEQVAGGGTVVDPEVVARLARRPTHEPLRSLSQREDEVLRLIAEGSSNASIAGQLNLSEKTVEGYVASTFTKLDLLPAPDKNRRVLAVLRYLQA